MKVGVTAASGNLGKATLKYLSAEIGAGNVIGISRSASKITSPGIEKRTGDYDEPEELIAAFRDIDTVILISAPVGDWDRVTMHRNAIEAARDAGVRKMLFTSVVGNGKEESTWFWQTQQVNRQAEIDLQNSGLEWVVARNGLYLEKDLQHIVHARSTGVYRNVVGNGRCGYISVDELAYATAKLALDDRHNGQVFNLVGETLTQAGLVDLANQVFGMNVHYETISDEDNIAVLMKDPKIAARGKKVAKMLTGCFQAVRIGAFDVASDFERAAGRPVKPASQMIEEQREAMFD